VPKLLIVDDEPAMVEMLHTFLRLNNFETVAASNGQDGLVLVKVEHPDLMILDLMLPDIEGFEVCRRVRSFPPSAKLPVLILSARSDALSKERALAAGANAYLVKPVRFADLLAALKRLLEAQSDAAKTPQPPPEGPDNGKKSPLLPSESPGGEVKLPPPAPATSGDGKTPPQAASEDKGQGIRPDHP
jgi:DNA-binding response OmpR family regulator